MATAREGTFIGDDVGYVKVDTDKQQARRVKCIIVSTPATADDGDTLAITLTNYGIKATGLLGIRGITHTVLNNELTVEAPTTSVTAGVLTITVGGSTDNLVRSFLIIGEAV